MKFSYILVERITPMGLPVQTSNPSFTDQVSGEVFTSTQLVRSFPLNNSTKPNPAGGSERGLFSWAPSNPGTRATTSRTSCCLRNCIPEGNGPLHRGNSPVERTFPFRKPAPTPSWES